MHNDELALAFDAVAGTVPALLELGAITLLQATRISAVDDELDRMSGQDHAELWTDEGIRYAPEWQRVRALAAAALAALD